MSTTELTKQESVRPRQAEARRWRRPRYDVAENNEAFVVTVSLPGVDRAGVDISLDNETLSVTGTRKAAIPEGWQPLRRELPEGDYLLNLRLNVRIEESKIAAKVEDGILSLTLPKADEIKPRKIKVD